MILPKNQLVLLPNQDWKVARIIRFRFRDHLCDCNGTVVYIRPFTQTYNKDTPDSIDSCILDAIKEKYTDVQACRKNLFWNDDYSDLQKIYDGGRPRTKLTIRMTPSLDIEILPKLAGQTLYAYDVCLNVFLDYIGKPERIPSDILLAQEFPYNQDQLFSTFTPQVVTL